MKKILLSVIVLLSILTSFIGCKFGIANDYASQELKSPEVEEIDSGIAIRLPVPSDPVSSILIYRYEEEIKTEESSSQTPKSVTHRSTKDNKLASSDIIGYINVEKLKSSDVFSYFFEDKLVELNKEYEYKARYTYKDSTQKYTKWSDPVVNNKNPTYTPTKEPISAEFDKDEMELTFQLEPLLKEEDNYKYSMIITAKPNKDEEKSVTQLFEITAPTMYLTKVLPSSFLEATGEVWLAGVVENEYLAFADDTPEASATKIGFSKIIPVEIKGIPSTDEKGSKIIDADITYDNDSYGIDYSKQAIKLQ